MRSEGYSYAEIFVPPSLSSLPGEDRFVLVGKKKKKRENPERRQAVKIINRKAYVVPRVRAGGKRKEKEELSEGGKEWQEETGRLP